MNHLTGAQNDLQSSGMGGFRDEVTADGVAWISQALQKVGGSKIPSNFQRTAPVHTPQAKRGSMPRQARRNPQTEALLKLLDLPYNLEPNVAENPGRMLACLSCLCLSHIPCQVFR